MKMATFREDRMDRMRAIDREQRGPGPGYMTDELKGLLQRRAKIAEQMKRLSDLVNTERRDFTETEKSGWEVCDHSYNELSDQIEDLKMGHAKDPASGFNRNLRNLTPGRDDVDHRNSIGDRFEDPYAPSASGVRLVDQRGRECRLLSRNESFRDAVCGPEDSSDQLSIGKCLIGSITGKWADAENERRTMLGVTDVSGGYLLPVGLSARIIDLARAKSVVLNAGAVTLPMDDRKLVLARLDQDPVASWKAEGAQISTTEAAIGAVILEARTLCAVVPISIELAEDSPNASRIVEDALVESLSLELDRGCLYGIGAEEQPLGILNQPNVGTTSIGGAPTFDNLLDGLTPVEQNNGMVNSWIVSPTVNGSIRKIKSGDGVYLLNHPAIDGLAKLVSSQCQNSEIFYGDFGQCVIGMRRRITIETFRGGTAGGQSAIDRMLIHIRAFLRADMVLMHPTHFNVLTNISV